ncbi:hypothetical protein C1J01_00375 [Nonomuraea aridisoli]|uniref:Uncharacterized protein n=1 Tax=Nonomuraea aridisoli TaxID=2070368 RepID=A0A2W2GA90_9ACTN|nr:hypothetical protein C1J01_00375 [Nonomuraea aridisoli]
MVGTWDGERLTLTEPARPAEPPEAPRDRTAFTTPCQKPAGGWRAVDPAKATQEAMTAALARAERLPGYAGGWLDQSYLDDIDGYEPDDPRSAERHANDPLRLVLNLRFTGDPATREPEIREVWGGALCLSQAEHTAAELRTLQEKVQEELTDAYSVSADERAGHVRAGVWAATPELRRHVDATYGKGMVVLDGLLQPVGP